VEVESYADFPLFIKTTDGDSAAMDGARGSFGELSAGAFDQVLLRYEVGDTALDLAVRNCKWLAAAAIIQIMTDHPLNASSEARTRARITAPALHHHEAPFNDIQTLFDATL